MRSFKLCAKATIVILKASIQISGIASHTCLQLFELLELPEEMPKGVNVHLEDNEMIESCIYARK